MNNDMNNPATKSQVFIAQFVLMSMFSSNKYIALACLILAIFVLIITPRE